MNKRILFYIIGLSIAIIVLLLLFAYNNREDNLSDKSNLGIYDAVDSSANQLLSNKSRNQTQNIYGAVDASVEQFLNGQ